MYIYVSTVAAAPAAAAPQPARPAARRAGPRRRRRRYCRFCGNLFIAVACLVLYIYI